MGIELTPELIGMFGMLCTIVTGYVKLERRLIIQEVQQKLILQHMGINPFDVPGQKK